MEEKMAFTSPQSAKKWFLFCFFNSLGAFAFNFSIIDHVSHKGRAENETERKMPLCKFKIYDHYIDTAISMGNLWLNFE